MDANLYQWRFNLKTGATKEGPIDDTLNSEFPTINSAWQGRRNRYAYNIVMARWPAEEPRFTGLVKYDLDTGRYRPSARARISGTTRRRFAARDNARSEDDGYLVSFVWNPDEKPLRDPGVRRLGAAPTGRWRGCSCPSACPTASTPPGSARKGWRADGRHGTSSPLPSS